MLMKHIIDAYEVLDSTYVTGEKVKEYLLLVSNRMQILKFMNLLDQKEVLIC